MAEGDKKYWPDKCMADEATDETTNNFHLCKCQLCKYPLSLSNERDNEFIISNGNVVGWNSWRKNGWLSVFSHTYLSYATETWVRRHTMTTHILTCVESLSSNQDSGGIWSGRLMIKVPLYLTWRKTRIRSQRGDSRVKCSAELRWNDCYIGRKAARCASSLLFCCRWCQGQFQSNNLTTSPGRCCRCVDD